MNRWAVKRIYAIQFGAKKDNDPYYGIGVRNAIKLADLRKDFYSERDTEIYDNMSQYITEKA